MRLSFRNLLQICSCPSDQQAFLSPLGFLGTHPAHPMLFCMLFLWFTGGFSLALLGQRSNVVSMVGFCSRSFFSFPDLFSLFRTSLIRSVGSSISGYPFCTDTENPMKCKATSCPASQTRGACRIPFFRPGHFSLIPHPKWRALLTLLAFLSYLQRHCLRWNVGAPLPVWMCSCWARQLGGPFAVEYSVLPERLETKASYERELLVEWMNKQTTWPTALFLLETWERLSRVGCDHNFCFQCFPEEICTTVCFHDTWGCGRPWPAPVCMIDMGGPDSTLHSFLPNPFNWSDQS